MLSYGGKLCAYRTVTNVIRRNYSRLTGHHIKCRVQCWESLLIPVTQYIPFVLAPPTSSDQAGLLIHVQIFAILKGTLKIYIHTAEIKVP